MIQKFLNFFRSNKIRDNKDYCLKIHEFYIENNLWKVLNTITKIDVTESEKTINISIESHQPGLIIGLRGRSIKDLSCFLTRTYSKEVKVNVNQCKLFFKSTTTYNN